MPGGTRLGARRARPALYLWCVGPARNAAYGRGFVTEILLLTAFAPKTAPRLALPAHRRAVLKDGERVADFEGFRADSATGIQAPGTEN